MAVIGIDLGTTYSAAAVCRPGSDGQRQPEIIMVDGGHPTMPSVVGLQANGRVAVGGTAKRNQAKHPQDTIIEAKRKMGLKERLKLGDKLMLPQEVSALVLRKLKEDVEAELGEPVEGVVISCPAYFKDPARAATRQAGELANLNVLRIINEPTAAAYAYGVAQGVDDQPMTFLVYDLGGGTFDVTVIRMVAGNIEVIGTGGDPHLGGGEFDDRIVDWICGRLKEMHPAFMDSLTKDNLRILRMFLKAYAEEGKKALCDSQDESPAYSFNIGQVGGKLGVHEGKPIHFSETLTMDQFEELIRDLMEKSFEWVEEALKAPREKHGLGLEDITAILLVGGSTRVPMVRRMLAERYPELEIRGQDGGINPDEIVAIGASITAADIDPESDEEGKTILVDVTGHTLSVAAIDDSLQREILHPIIPKESRIPCEQAHRFSSSGNFQEQAHVRVYQGEGPPAPVPMPGSMEIDLSSVEMIGDFMLVLPRRQEKIPLQIGLRLDENGILFAHGAEKATGKHIETKIDYADSAQISPQELEAKRAQQDQLVNRVFQKSFNPFDDNAQAGNQGGAWVPTAHPAAPPTTPGGMPMQAAPAGPIDITATMNPITRSLYDRAVSNFHLVPEDRRQSLMQVVMEIEAAARAGDRQRVDGYSQQMAELLEGVS